MPDALGNDLEMCRKRRGRRRLALWGAFALLIVAAAVGGVVLSARAPSRSGTRSGLWAGPGEHLVPVGLAVSPDGERLAVNPRADTSTASTVIGLMPVHGGAPRWVDTGLGVAAHFTWSPDSSKVAFAGLGEGGRGSMHIAVCDFTAGETSALVRPRSRVVDLWPQWSPTGEWIAFQRRRFAANGRDTSDTWIVRPDGQDARNATHSGHVAMVGGAWSADGRELYYVQRDPGGQSPTRGDVYVVAIGQGHATPRRLTSGIRAKFVVPSSCGEYLQCHAETEEGESSIQVLPIADPSHPVAVLPGGPSPVVSPDGQWLAFLDHWKQGPHTRTYELWKMPITKPEKRMKLADEVCALATLGWTAAGEIVFCRRTSIWAVRQDGADERLILELPEHVVF